MISRSDPLAHRRPRTLTFVAYPQEQDPLKDRFLEAIGWSTTAVQHHSRTCPGRVAYPHYDYYTRKGEQAPQPLCLGCYQFLEENKQAMWCPRWGVEVWLHRLLRPWYRRQARRTEFGYTMRAIEEYDSARAHGELSDMLVEGMCPKCYLQFDMGQPPWFIATASGTSFDGEYTTHWCDGVQHCPRCNAKFDYELRS